MQATTVTLPTEVLEDASRYVIMHETASKAVPTDALPRYNSPEVLLTTYMRHTMTAFSNYPPAWIIHFLIKSPSDRATFNSAYIKNLNFQEGDLVCGVYRVVKRTSNSVELLFDAPESYRGPPATGMLATKVEQRGEQTVFLNDVILWRKKHESPVPLESGIGRWMHAIIAMSLMENGTQKLIKSAKV